MSLKKYVADGSLYAWALLRIVLGYIFLWAFLDKLFGLGFATCKVKASGLVDVGCSQAWVNGGSPTKGFLANATTGPFQDFYHNLAGRAWVDWLFMLGLLVIGLGLLLGTWIRLAAFAGIVLMLLMWSSLLWPANSPGVDEHIVYAIALFGIALTAEHQAWSLRSWWLKTRLAQVLPFLK
ncbi:DoxX family membrane protein [Candidatus Saccharibacteria bacterium]|nr:DoxX family membrane protein [Candidatus Saccharibacteria bacterium]